MSYVDTYCKDDKVQKLYKKYLSESKGVWIPIGEMDLIHIVRAFNKRERTIKDENTKMLFQIMKDMMDPKEIN